MTTGGGLTSQGSPVSQEQKTTETDEQNYMHALKTPFILSTAVVSCQVQNEAKEWGKWHGLVLKSQNSRLSTKRKKMRIWFVLVNHNLNLSHPITPHPNPHVTHSHTNTRTHFGYQWKNTSLAPLLAFSLLFLQHQPVKKKFSFLICKKQYNDVTA